MTFAEAIPAATAHLGKNTSVDFDLPENGRLHIDRPLPFLCVYRIPSDRGDAGTAEFVTTEAAFLIAPADDEHYDDVAALGQAIGDTLYNRFGGFLFVEVWACPFAADARGPQVQRPTFRVVVPERHAPEAAAETLVEALRDVTLDRQPADVDLVSRSAPWAPGLRPLYRPADAERVTCRHLGLEIDTVYRRQADGPTYPLVLASLRRQIAPALRRALFEFARNQLASAMPEHYQALGPHGVIAALRTVDRQLLRTAAAFDFVLLATPTNADEAWQQFRQDRFSRAPSLHYRPLPIHPDLVRRRLYAIRLEALTDPTLQHLLREQRTMIDLQVSMLAVRGTRDFMYGSLRLYGDVEAELLSLAREVMACTDGGSPAASGPAVGAREFERRAREEIRRYRVQLPTFRPRVHRRNDIASDVMVVRGDLLISDSLRVRHARVDAVIHHEVGTHVVTYYNGAAQPFRLLRAGLAGYESLQEGLAVLAEHLSGALTRARLRQLAARVIAVHSLTQGGSFVDTFACLHEEYGLSAHRAFTTTVRVFRAGGLTKDAVYLRGLASLLGYLSNDGDIDPLLVGKVGLRHVPLVQELTRRNILRPPRLRPHYLQNTESQARLEACRGRSVLDLCLEAI